MEVTNRFELSLPPSQSRTGEPEQVEHEGAVVIVGANGSGKTRLGTWIELQSEHRASAHRVSAQKSLTVPASVSPKSVNEAASELLFGYAREGAGVDHKIGHRWRSNPNTFLLDDYGRLLVYLFSEDYDVSIAYRQQSRDSNQRIEPPETKLDVVKQIWEKILPHRELILGGGKIETRAREAGAAAYSASEMSDGERVVLYLIGECLAAPSNAVIVIDEPELHLHKAIQAKLWNEVEAQRTDCQFVYLTHDVDFAASRTGAPKIWLKSFNGVTWDWDIVPDADDLPEELLLELVGSRKPILFVEGDRNSLDSAVYTHVYPEHTVTPVGSASAVIHNTAAFEALRPLHGLDCRGIIDRDQRTDAEVSYLGERRVHVIDFAEVENVFLTEPVLMGVARALLVPDSAGLIESVQRLVMESLERDREHVISAVVASRVERSLKSFDGRARGVAALTDSLTAVCGSIDVARLYRDTTAEINQLVTEKDYTGALRVYSNKGLIFDVARLFGMDGRNYRELVQRLMKSNPQLTDAVRSTMPGID